MKHIVLVHWNHEEAEERADSLRRAGYAVQSYTKPDPAAFRPIRANPPDAIVIDLGRSPSQGRDVAVWFRRQKGTRNVPIVFVEGDPEKTRRVRKLLPDAIYTPWSQIRSALRQAMRAPSPKPGPASASRGAETGEWYGTAGLLKGPIV